MEDIRNRNNEDKMVIDLKTQKEDKKLSLGCYRNTVKRLKDYWAEFGKSFYGNQSNILENIFKQYYLLHKTTNKEYLPFYKWTLQDMRKIVNFLKTRYKPVDIKRVWLKVVSYYERDFGEYRYEEYVKAKLLVRIPNSKKEPRKLVFKRQKSKEETIKFLEDYYKVSPYNAMLLSLGFANFTWRDIINLTYKELRDAPRINNTFLRLKDSYNLKEYKYVYLPVLERILEVNKELKKEIRKKYPNCNRKYVFVTSKGNQLNKCYSFRELQKDLAQYNLNNFPINEIRCCYEEWCYDLDIPVDIKYRLLLRENTYYNEKDYCQEDRVSTKYNFNEDYFWGKSLMTFDEFGDKILSYFFKDGYVVPAEDRVNTYGLPKMILTDRYVRYDESPYYVRTFGDKKKIKKVRYGVMMRTRTWRRKLYWRDKTMAHVAGLSRKE